jgi:hypothetical protein
MTIRKSVFVERQSKSPSGFSAANKPNAEDLAGITWSALGSRPSPNKLKISILFVTFASAIRKTTKKANPPPKDLNRID